MSFGLSTEALTRMRQVFSRYPQVDKVLIYGSRAKGTYKRGSDIDLTLVGDHVDQPLCGQLAEDLDDLLLPYMIDLSVFSLLNHPGLEEHIRRVGQVLYQRGQ